MLLQRAAGGREARLGLRAGHLFDGGGTLALPERRAGDAPKGRGDQQGQGPGQEP